jgi:predicted Co/Zn/Cd cation transporter (cation efflux family)
MKAYVMTTGVIFALLVVAHIWRIIAESPSLVTDPGYILITLAAGLLSLWAARLLWRSRSP